jgi:hypothetical protein
LNTGPSAPPNAEPITPEKVRAIRRKGIEALSWTRGTRELFHLSPVGISRWKRNAGWKSNATPRARAYDDATTTLVHRGDTIQAIGLVEAPVGHISQIVGNVKTGFGSVVNSVADFKILPQARPAIGAPFQMIEVR